MDIKSHFCTDCSCALCVLQLVINLHHMIIIQNEGDRELLLLLFRPLLHACNVIWTVYARTILQFFWSIFILFLPHSTPDPRRTTTANNSHGINQHHFYIPRKERIIMYILIYIYNTNRFLRCSFLFSCLLHTCMPQTLIISLSVWVFFSSF